MGGLFIQENVEKTRRKNHCVSCGVCGAICPTDAINLDFCGQQNLPAVDRDYCNNCGLCLQTCPGYSVDYEHLYELRGRPLPTNLIKGSNLGGYIGYAKDEKSREIGTSGGLITTFICNLLEKEVYEGAFVVDWDEPSNLRPRAEFTSDKEKVFQAAKSKYLPVSVKQVVMYIENNPDSKIIVVCTPCQLYGILKFCDLKDLSLENVLFLGLFCEKTLNQNIFDYYKDRYGAEDEAIKTFEYKNKKINGWPGDTRIVFDSGKEIFVHRKIRSRLKKYFQLERCLFCLDKFNQLADISFGDCYIEGFEDKKGVSNIIIRSAKGQQILDEVKPNLELCQIEPEKVYESQNAEAINRKLFYDKINEGAKVNKGFNVKDGIDRKFKAELDERLKRIELGKNYRGNKEVILKKTGFNLLRRLLAKLFKALGVMKIGRKIVEL